MMTADKAVYKCPCCDYSTHFLKALEAHQRHRKHFPQPKVEVKAVVEEIEPVPEETVVAKKTRKPRNKKAGKETE